jgi:hypothetical protein
MGDALKIIFTNTTSFTDLEPPQLSSKFMPEWYKKMDSYIGNKKIPDGGGNSKATIKKCMPVFDAINAGYIIVSPADVYVSIKDGAQYFEWSDLSLIGFHPIEQAPDHPMKKPHAYPKWINYWAIKTPKGYSTMFVQPMHRESVFTILPGIVDTDTYCAPVNFPMVINDPEFEGLIPKGTPIAQVIPFKRDSWSMKFGGKKELQEQANVTKNLQTKFFDRYKNMFRQSKEYK